jgi:hypothetical protein
MTSRPQSAHCFLRRSSMRAVSLSADVAAWAYKTAMVFEFAGQSAAECEYQELEEFQHAEQHHE